VSHIQLNCRVVWEDGYMGTRGITLSHVITNPRITITIIKTNGGAKFKDPSKKSTK